MAVLAAIAAAVVALNQETSLITASVLLRFAFFIAIAVAVYMLWRDFGRREIGLWAQRQQWVFYGACGLLLADLAWYFTRSLGGRDLLAFLLTAAACVVAAVRTWREQRRYG